MPKLPLVRPEPQALASDPAAAAIERPESGRKRDGAARLAFNGQLLEHWGCYPLGNGHRMYNPALMIFQSPDSLSPFGRGGLHSYGYCLGDPINFTDSSGRSVDEIFSSYILPGLSIVLNVFLFRTAVSVIRNRKSTREAATASMFSAVGALVGIYGAAERILGNPGGAYISGVGTAISIVGAARRYKLTRAAEKKAWTETAHEEAMAAAATSTRRTSMVSPEPLSPRAASAPPLDFPGPAAPIPSAPPMASRGGILMSPASAPGSLSRGIPPVAGPQSHLKKRPSLQVLISLSEIRKGHGREVTSL